MTLFGDTPAPWTSVVAFDPGGTTGWAWIMFESRMLAADGPLPTLSIAAGLHEPWLMYGEIDCRDQRKGAAVMERWVRSALARCDRLTGGGRVRAVVVVEAFVLREQTSSSNLLSPILLAARLDQLLGDDVEWFYQSPADAMSVCSDGRMKAWGWWIKGQPHATDALRHLVLWLRKELNGEHSTD